MTPKDISGNAGRPLAVEVAIIGAGPVGLMTANLLGLAGIRVLVLERNAGLLGLPRAIAYDAETLRLFSQVGLFDDIAPGLIQDPHVRHVNARNVTLMAADFPRGLYGHSSLGTFYQPDFERVLLKGLARFPSVRVAFGHEATDLVQNAKGVTLSVATPSGATTVEADYVVACDGGASPTRERLGVRLVGSTYLERWLVVDAIVTNHGVTQITFRCDPRRPRVELPAVGERVRWEFMQLPGESEETLKRDARLILEAAPDYVVPAAVSFVASNAQSAPKAVETKDNLAKLMLRVDLKIDPKVVETYYGKVETGLRGAGFVRTRPDAKWPAELQVKLPPAPVAQEPKPAPAASRAGGRPSLRPVGARRRADVRGCSCACRQGAHVRAGHAGCASSGAGIRTRSCARHGGSRARAGRAGGCARWRAAIHARSRPRSGRGGACTRSAGVPAHAAGNYVRPRSCADRGGLHVRAARAGAYR